MAAYATRLICARPLTLVVLVQLWTQTAAAQAPTTPNLEHTKWQLVRFEERGGAIARPDDPAKYTVEFGDRLVAHLECTDGSSTWKASDGELRFGKLEGAGQKCVSGSMSDRILRDWREIRSYSVRSNLLYLALKNGQGWYVFQRFVPIATRPTASDARQYGPLLQFDSKGVQFGPWIRRFLAQLKRNWYAVMPPTAISLSGHSVLSFDVSKDGQLTDVRVMVPSGVESFNSAAANALLLTSPTEPLPAEYPTEKVRFTITFYYNEKPPDTPATVSPQ